MRLRFRPEARLDLLEASAWYEDRSRGLGTEFVRAVDVTTAGILRSPESFPTVYENVRMAVLRRFPYALLYVVDSDGTSCARRASFPRRRWQTLLDVNQATVSKMERRTDMYVSTMRRFVRAMGGELEIRARFPEGVVEIDQFGAIPTMPSTAPEQGTDAPAEDEGGALRATG